MDCQTNESRPRQGILSRSSIRTCALPLLALIVALPAAAGKLTLAPETVRAWDDFVQLTKSQMEQRATSSGTPYLWVDEVPERINRLRAGEIIVAPLEGQGSRKAPAGLIHRWIGAAFIPNTRIQDVLQVIRDYPHYKDLYQPSVTSSKALAKGDMQDRFSTRLVNRSILLKSAFEMDYESCYIRLDERRVYSFTWSTRIQEIEDYGAAAQRMWAEGEGSGIMWRLFSITRYLERDGGVYIEVEAMGLTRDIPAALHWVVDPIVRRLSRSALTISLQQTGKAAHSVAEFARREHEPGTSLSARGGLSSARP